VWEHVLRNESNKMSELYVERYTEIERENRILLEKMTTIMAQKPKPAESKLFVPSKVGSQLSIDYYGREHWRKLSIWRFEQG
jgi:hypothetical protein